MMIIGFAGKKGSGKTEAVNFLSKYFKYVRLSFADPLKQMVDVYLNHTIPSTFIEKDKLIKNLCPLWEGTHIGDLTYRELLQGLGTEGMRGWMSTIWTERMWVRIRQISENNPDIQVFFIDDVRFQNEANMMDVVYQINRPGHESEDSHSSENQIIKGAEVIENDGTLFQFHKKLLTRAESWSV